MELDRLRTAVERCMALEAERDECMERQKVLQQELARLKLQAEEEMTELEKLEGFSLRGAFLSLTGKKEAHLQQAQRRCRETGAALAGAEFRRDGVIRTLRELEGELSALREQEREYCRRLLSQSDDPALSENWESLSRMEQAEALWAEIAGRKYELRKLADRGVDACLYGDVQVDLSGNRHNNRWKAMDNAAAACQAAFYPFLDLLEQFDALEPGTVTKELTGPWTGRAEYLTEPMSEGELQNRLEGLLCWLLRLEDAHRRGGEKRRAREASLREELRRGLFALHDSLG